MRLIFSSFIKTSIAHANVIFGVVYQLTLDIGQNSDRDVINFGLSGQIPCIGKSS